MKSLEDPILISQNSEALDGQLIKEKFILKDCSTAKDSQSKRDIDSLDGNSKKILESESPIKQTSFSSDDSFENIQESKAVVVAEIAKRSKDIPRLREEFQRQKVQPFEMEIKGTSEISSIVLLHKSLFFQILYHVASFMTLGLLSVFNKWSNNRLFCKFCFRVVNELSSTDHVAIVDNLGDFVVTLLKKKQIWTPQGIELSTFVFEHNYRLFFFDQISNAFCNLFETTERSIYENFNSQFRCPRVEEDVALLADTFGPNRLMPDLKSFKSIVVDSVLTPLVFFEALCLYLLYSNGQSVYFVLLLCLFGTEWVMGVIDKYRCENKLLEAINFAEQIMVIRKSRDGIFKKRIIDSSEIVVGDMVEVTNSLKVPADMVLVQGVCVVKEDFAKEDQKDSTRIALDSMGVSDPRNRKCSLLAGNQVLYTLNRFNESCLAVVVRIGFDCKRAEKLKQMLVARSIRKQPAWQLQLLLVAVAVCCIYPLTELFLVRFFHKKGLVNLTQTIHNLTILLIVFIKPIVPILFLIVVRLSTRRLTANRIIVNDVQQFQTSGRIKNVVFESKLLLTDEKTTAGYVLSTDDKDGQRPVFEKILTNPKRLFKSAESNLKAKKFCEVAGLCNLVFKVGGEMFGNETERELMSSSAFNLINVTREDGDCSRSFIPKNEYTRVFSREYTVFRYLTDSQNDGYRLQSVLARNSEGQNFVLAKGDPMAMEHLIDPNTLPSNFNVRVAKYANKGFKCLAFAYKEIDANNSGSTPEKLQSQLTFLGLYLFKFCAPENTGEVMRTLQASDINVTLMSNGSIFSGIATARNNDVISADKKVVLVQTEVINGTERFLVTMMEPQVGGVTVNESAISSDKLNVVRMEDSSEKDILKSTDCLAMTGRAFSLLLENESSEFMDTVLERCRVYGNLTDAERTKVMRMLRERGTQPVCYVYHDIGCDKTVREADISINLKANSLSPYSTFSSATSDLGQVIDIIREARATHANLTQVVGFSLFFVLTQIVGYSALAFRDTSFARNQLLFLDFFVLATLALWQANIKPTDLSAEHPHKLIFNKETIVKSLTSVVTSTLAILTMLWLLSKAKFYISPSAMSLNSRDKSPDSYFFYDPYVVFQCLIFVNAFFVFHSLRHSRFVKNFFGKTGLMVYWSLLLLFALYLLFIYDFSSKWVINQALIKVFRIPGMFHFEIIIFLTLPILYFSFSLAKIAQDRLAEFTEDDSNEIIKESNKDKEEDNKSKDKTVQIGLTESISIERKKSAGKKLMKGKLKKDVIGRVKNGRKTSSRIMSEK